MGQAVCFGVKDSLAFREALMYWCNFPDVFHVLMYESTECVRKSFISNYLWTDFSEGYKMKSTHLFMRETLNLPCLLGVLTIPFLLLKCCSRCWRSHSGCASMFAALVAVPVAGDPMTIAVVIAPQITIGLVLTLWETITHQPPSHRHPIGSKVNQNSI